MNRTIYHRKGMHAGHAAPTGGSMAIDASFLPEHFGRPERIRQIMLAAASALLCWHVLRVSSLNFSAADFFFIVSFLILLARNRLNLIPMQTMTAQWYVALVMMLGGLLIGSVFNGDPLRWASVAGQYLFGFLILPMILMSEDRAWVRKCLLFFVYGVVASQILAILAAEFLTLEQAKALVGQRIVAGNGRIEGLVSDANLNGGVVAFAIIALLNLLHHGLIRWFAALILGAVLFWSVLASGSFTAFAAAGIAITIYFLFSDLGRFLKIGVPIILLSGFYIAYGFPLPEAFSERVLGALLEGDLNQAGTYTHRATLIADAWDVSRDTLFVGLGADEFRRTSSYAMPVHQLWLLMLTEGGLLSLTGLALIFVILGIMGFKALGRHREDGAMALAMLAIFAIFSTSMPHMYNRLWIAPVIMALAASYGRSPARPTAPFDDDAYPYSDTAELTADTREQRA